MGQFGVQPRERADFRLELGALAAELLRTLGVVPELGLLELALDFGQAVLLGVEVKDTPVRPGTGRADRAACGTGD
jgi:hypothetical protein